MSELEERGPARDDTMSAFVASDHEHLVRLVDVALFPVLGGMPKHDDNGDIVVMFSDTVVYVRALDDQPFVQLMGPMVIDVGDLTKAAFEVSSMNSESYFVRYVLLGDAIGACAHVPAHPFVPKHLQTYLHELLMTIEEVADDLATKVDGHRFAYG